MKPVTLTLILLILPMHTYGKCDNLDSPAWYPNKTGSSELDIEYFSLVYDYVDKHRNNYRPETFFNRHSKIIKRTSDIEDELLRKQLMNKRLSFLSSHFHYDDSLKNYFEKLAEQQYSRSFYCLGFIYELGIGVEVDYIQAWAWFYTAYSVDGIYAEKYLNRVSNRLNVNSEVRAKRLADKYMRQYTNFDSTPSFTIIR